MSNNNAWNIVYFGQLHQKNYAILKVWPQNPVPGASPGGASHQVCPNREHQNLGTDPYRCDMWFPCVIKDSALSCDTIKSYTPKQQLHMTSESTHPIPLIGYVGLI